MAKKTKKRGNGEGSIIQRKDGRWMGSITIGRNTNGKLIRKCIYGKTRKEVQDRMVQVASELAKGSFFEPSKMLLKDWLINWLKNYKSIKLKPKTYDGYETIINSGIIPFIGDKQLKELQASDIQKFYNDRYNDGKGLATSTIRKTHVILKSALKQAVTNDLIHKNPADYVELPSMQKREIRAFTKAEQKKFEHYSKEYRLYEAFIINLDTGMRLCEILALTWDDVDLDINEIHIKKNLVSVKDRSKSNKKNKLLVQNSSKTKNSTRSIPLTKRCVLLLKELKIRQQKLSEIVFCSKVGTHVSPRNYERTFQKICKKAGIDNCNTHTMRHSFATRLFEAGVPAKTISQLLGHSSVSFTLDTYTHVLPDTKNEAIKVLESISL